MEVGDYLVFYGISYAGQGSEKPAWAGGRAISGIQLIHECNIHNGRPYLWWCLLRCDAHLLLALNNPGFLERQDAGDR